MHFSTLHRAYELVYLPGMKKFCDSQTLVVKLSFVRGENLTRDNRVNGLGKWVEASVLWGRERSAAND